MAGAAALVLLHLDFWRPQRAILYFGWLPEEMAYRLVWVFLAWLYLLAFTTYLFYSGVPVMMEIPTERGFLFSSAMLAFGLVTLVALLAITALLWGTPGIAPSFTS